MTQTEPQPLYIVSIDASLYDSAEWFSRVRYKLSESQSINRMYRWVCWPFTNIPAALSAIKDHPSNEFIYLRIDPSEHVMNSFSNGNRKYLDNALKPLTLKNCVVFFEDDHTDVSGVERPNIDIATDRIKEALEKRSIRTELINSRIDDVSQFGQQAIGDIQRQIAVKGKEISKLGKEFDEEVGRIGDRLSNIETILGDHNDSIEALKRHSEKVSEWAKRGRGVFSVFINQIVFKWLVAAGVGAGLLEIVKSLWE